MRKYFFSKKQHSKKGANWTNEEDQKLIDYIKIHGEGDWRTLPKAAGLQRCGKSCRLRWINYLKPDIKRGNFGEGEDDLIIKLHALLGNRWSLIAGRLPGRTDNEVKNYWNSNLKKKLINMGIDPNNHRVNQTLKRPILSEYESFSSKQYPSKKIMSEEEESVSSSCPNNFTAVEKKKEVMMDVEAQNHARKSSTY
ncbi:hypothetical protein ACJIZ3_014576 [Penstemon smallii]|uniref:Uncharacterized protein n=1 Tax=Penstemon smallii TaxID=265156 RepID=A0ABD3RK87_9LAMI